MFIKDSVISLALLDRGTMFDANRFQNKFNAARVFVASSTTMSEEFKQNCQHTMSIRKKNVNNPFFNLLGYNFIFVTRGKDIDEKTELKPVAQMREDYKKLRGDNALNVCATVR